MTDCRACEAARGQQGTADCVITMCAITMAADAGQVSGGTGRAGTGRDNC